MGPGVAIYVGTPVMKNLVQRVVKLFGTEKIVDVIITQKRWQEETETETISCVGSSLNAKQVLLDVHAFFSPPFHS